MKKINMIKAVDDEANVTDKVAEKVMESYGKIVLGVLTENKDEKVSLPGLGNFSVKHVSERSGVSALGDKKPWTKPAHDELKFTISRSVREL